MFTKPSTLMGKRSKAFLIGIVLLSILAGGWYLVFSPDKREFYGGIPTLERTVQLNKRNVDLRPTHLQVVDNSLYVSYKGLSRLDVFNLDLQRMTVIELKAPETILPTSFSVTDTSIVICDHDRGVIANFDRRGNYQSSFGTLPDGVTSLSPIALACYSGTAYVADKGLSKVLVISLNTIPDVTEAGEMIFTIPGDQPSTLSFPTSVAVSPDGRLLIGDSGDGAVKVFTCDGRQVYEFDCVQGEEKVAPQAMAFDQIIDPSLQDEHSADPSGLRNQGRIHVLDWKNGKVHMFNPLGTLLASYPQQGRLDYPSDIAIDEAGERIFIADPSNGEILIYRIEGE